MQMEEMLLKFYKWQVLHPTAAEFIDYYLRYAVNPSDIHNKQRLDSLTSKAKTFVANYCTYFLEISLQGLAIPFFKINIIA